MIFVPVVDSHNQPLMPTIPSRARRWVKSGKATPFWNKGVWSVRLNSEPSGRETQPIVVGIDPGSKKEGFSVKSKAHTYLNVQADAVTWVSDHVETRRMMRQARRYRKTPYRECRSNRNVNAERLPPSTRARWGWKLRIVDWLARLFPVTQYIVEDIRAKTLPGQAKWNKSFSPLEVGKAWFYAELGKRGTVNHECTGMETHELRQALGLKKIKNKMSDKFEAHCIDSWTLANFYLGGHIKPDNTAILYLVPLRFHRRQFHRLQPEKGNIRNPYGGTLSLGLKRGSWVKHPKWGVCYVGGTTGSTVSLHSLQTGERIAKVKPDTLQFLTYSSWRVRKEVSPSPPA